MTTVVVVVVAAVVVVLEDVDDELGGDGLCVGELLCEVFNVDEVLLLLLDDGFAPSKLSCEPPPVLIQILSGGKAKWVEKLKFQNIYLPIPIFT